MRRLATFLIVLGLVTPVAAEVELGNDDQRVLYALGLAISQRLNMFDLSEAEVAIVQAGLADGILNREPQIELNAIGPMIDPFLAERGQAALDREKAEGKEFVAQAAAQAGATILDSGVVYFDVEEGEGVSPAREDTVIIEYTGTFRSGVEFDKTVEGEPATFSLGGVVPCFTDGVSLMKVGGKARVICPPETAYGDQGRPGIRPGSTLIFELKLLGIVEEASEETSEETSEAPETPDASAPSDDE
jgi:FKBP-type peptidyl-prolyl cis-trans isomerase FkpA/FKBP-type peptidyl-prolyl cis-trans isomerase FklB